jgi:radical SAM protein (TIGR01212 family)
MERFFSASQYYRRQFGCRIYKLSLDAGCTCPTRDGTKGTGGCIFCSAAGSGDFAASRSLTISGQIEQAKRRVESKNSGGKYIAYFQNFTSTYGDHSALEQKYREALAAPGVAGISIATRPDCIDDDMLARIASLCTEAPVSVELGFQSSRTETVQYIRRGYGNNVYDDTVHRIHRADGSIHIVTHVIFGLPGETEEDMLATVRHCIAAGTDGIKITVLHVLEGTDLALDYRSGRFKCMEMDEYFAAVSHALEIIPRNVVIHRLTGDGPKRILIAPLWTAQKHTVLNAMNRWFEEHDVMQGRYA